LAIKTWPALGLSLGLALGVGACGSSSTTASGAGAGAAASGDTILIKNFGFSPSSLTVAPGATVTVRNEDNSTHTVTADSGGFDTGNIAPGHSASFKAPASAGAYSYHCALHQFMHGRFKVSG
jgi:plastocyanin